MPTVINDEIFDTQSDRKSEGAEAKVIAAAVEKKTIELKAEKGVEEKAEKQAVETVEKQAKSMRDRIANAEGGEWVRYTKSLSKTFGKSYTTSILPITYTFQQGLKTFVLDEHVEHIYDIFDRRLRAEGFDISKDPFKDVEAEIKETIDNEK